MSEPKVHNYAFRKALGYVRNKKGKLGSLNIRETFMNTTHQNIAEQYPYVPSYYPAKSFVILLQIIENNLEDKKIVSEEKRTPRSHEVGFYLYTGPNEADSPYHYLDPHKELSQVIDEFYHNLKTPSAIFRNCETTLETEGDTLVATWKKREESIELFYYLEGVHTGMIKESSSDGELAALKEKDAFIYRIKMLD